METVNSLTKDEAMRLVETRWWTRCNPEEIVRFQLFTDRLCMPFDRFHWAVEKVLGRPVYTHEFAFAAELRKEVLGEKEPPTVAEILDLIPEARRVVVVADEVKP